MEQLQPHDLPEPFAAIDQIAKGICEAVYENLENNDEIVSRADVEHVPWDNTLWPNASGGWTVEFRCDLRNSYSHGITPKRLVDAVEDLTLDALKEHFRTNEPYPGAAEDVEAALSPPRLKSLYEFAADKLGKTKEQVDHDIRRSAFQLLDNLTDSQREEFYETENAFLDSHDYCYGLDVVYLRPNDRGNPFGRPMVEIDATFNADHYRRNPETIATRYVEPEALTESLAELLARWVEHRFWEQ